jgi:hypothetical protein
MNATREQANHRLHPTIIRKPVKPGQIRLCRDAPKGEKLARGKKTRQDQEPGAALRFKRPLDRPAVQLLRSVEMRVKGGGDAADQKARGIL